jgi:hypothetical protein
MFSMPKKDVLTNYNGHQIRVTNTWLGGAKLYIDGDCRDTSNDLFSLGQKPVLSSSLEANGTKEIIEVYVRAVTGVLIKICANGAHIAGDTF